MLKRDRVSVVSVSEPLAEGPFGTLVERMIEWMDEYYSIRLSGEVFRGMSENAMRGNFQASPPLGYRIPYHRATPVVVEEEAAVVRLIFQKYVQEEMAISDIASYLNQLGFRTARGKRFEKRSIAYILQNVGVIIGIMADNRTAKYGIPNQTEKINEKWHKFLVEKKEKIK